MHFNPSTGLFHKEPPEEERSITADTLYGGESSSFLSGAGSSNRAMAIASVYACVKAIAETVSTLPLKLYQSPDGVGGSSRKRAKDHYLSGFLADAPNESMTWVEAREALAVEQVLRGNSYGRVTWSRGYVESIRPYASGSVTPMETASGRVVYQVHDGRGATTTARDVAHFKGLTCNGITGLSPITECRYAIAEAKALNEHALNSSENGIRLQGVLKNPKPMKEEAMKAVRESWQSAYAGANGQRVAILPGDMDFSPISMTLQDAQFIEQMNFSVEEIARIFAVPPHIIGHLARSTNNNIEHQGKEFYQRCIRPWLKRIDQTLNRALLTTDERKQGYYFEHDPDGILSADYKTRIEGQKIAIQGGFKTINEVRALNNDPPIEGGDTALVPLNHAPIALFNDPQYIENLLSKAVKTPNKEKTEGNE